MTQNVVAPRGDMTQSGQPSQAELMTLPEVARYLSVAERTVYLWAQQGRIPAFKMGSAWRFRRWEIDSWLDTQRSGPAVSQTVQPLTDPIEPPRARQRIRMEEEAASEALIVACMSFIEETTRNSDQQVWAIEQFEDRFGADVVDSAISRLRKQRKVRVDEERGLDREKVRVLRRRV